MRRSHRIPTALAGALALGVALHGCGGAPEADPQAQKLAKQLLGLMAVATEGGVAHSGDRYVEFHFTDAQGFPQTLAYREHVEVDGLGGFDLTPIEVLSLDAGSAGEFLLTQDARSGFAFRYRDFAVRDIERFLENYQLSALGGVAEVAGRDGVQFRLARAEDPDSYFDLVADLETGLVLRAREYALDGALLSHVEYESLAIGPPASFVPFDSPFTETPLHPEGAALDLPSWLPPGFGIDEASRIELGGRSWTKLVYTDGLEPLFLLYGDSLEAVDPSLAPGGGLVQPGFGEAPEPSDAAPVIQRVPAGEWTAMRWIGGSQDVLVVGKVAGDDLQLFLESILP